LVPHSIGQNDPRQPLRLTARPSGLSGATNWVLILGGSVVFAAAFTWATQGPFGWPTLVKHSLVSVPQ